MLNIFIKKIVAVLIVCFIQVGFAGSMNDFNAAFNKVCNKTKQCAMAELRGDASVPPEMVKMVESSMIGMCQGIKDGFHPQLFAGHKHIMDAATACLQSMEKQSCDAMNSGNETEACKKYNKLAEKYE